jgi:uncharacterized protein (TIGR01777 family)
MRTIITGGTGLIGRALAADLNADGHQVVVLSRNPDQSIGLPQSVQVEWWDARTAEGWGQLADGARAIVNLAGAGLADSRWTEQRKQLIRDSRLNTGRAVVQAVDAATSKPEVVVQASGVGYYGPRGNEEITEKDSAGNGFLSQVAIQWEDATAPVDEMGIRRPIIRTSPVLASQGGALPRMLLPFRLFVGGPLGGGKQWFPWIHMADEVRAIRFLMEHTEATGPFNLTAPNPVTNADFARALGRVMRRPALFPAPAFALRLLFGEMATALLDGQRAVPQRLLDLGFAFRFPEIETALRDILG